MHCTNSGGKKPIVPQPGGLALIEGRIEDIMVMVRMITTNEMIKYQKVSCSLKTKRMQKEEKSATKKMEMGCCRCGRGSGCWFRDQQRSQDRKGLPRRGEDGLPTSTVREARPGNKKQRLSCSADQSSLCLLDLSLLGSLFSRWEGITTCVRQCGLRALSSGVSCARGRP